MKKTTLTSLLSSILLGAALAVTSVATTASAAKPYTPKTCIVSGNELGSMGKVITKTHEGQEVKFCCKPCIKKFDANPAKYLSRLK